jgi:hypothetical protein
MANRKLRPGQFGPLRSRVVAVTPTEKLGLLTPVRPAAIGYGNWLFDCDCGERVTKVAREVAKNAARGQVPRCSPSCTGKPALAESAGA